MSELIEALDQDLKRNGLRKGPKKASVTFEGGSAILDDYFRVPVGTYKILKRNIEKGVPSLLIGVTGTGKSELAFCMAKTMGLPVTMMDMGTMVDPIMGLVGTHSIKVKDGRTSSSFIKSRFSRLIQEPGVVVLDEISRANAMSNNLLFPVLDFRKELAMEYSFDDTEPIKVHDKCAFIATANMGSQYTGTHKLDKALIDRFMMIEVDPLSVADLKKVVKHDHSKVAASQVDKMVQCFTQINKDYDDCKISFCLSLRHLKMVASLVNDDFTIYDSFYTICKGNGSKEGLKTVETILADVK